MDFTEQLLNSRYVSIIIYYYQWLMLAWLSGMRCRLAYSPADATAVVCILVVQPQAG